jgi:endonuclease
MIDVLKPFMLYANCSVEYAGRANSSVGPGLRVILHKADGSLIVHKASNVTPMNYIGPKSTLTLENQTLTGRSKTERVTILINEIIHYHELIEWSNDSIKLTGTENELCEKLIANAGSLLGIGVSRVQRELLTVAGPIDVVFTDFNDIRHCVEVKRKKITMSAIYQLYRYLSHMSPYACVGYLAGPDIGNSARREADKYGYKFVKIDHSI